MTILLDTFLEHFKKSQNLLEKKVQCLQDHMLRLRVLTQVKTLQSSNLS